jgi:threonine dehydrogenase-like Zn-dependent dehydrogenase
VGRGPWAARVVIPLDCAQQGLDNFSNGMKYTARGPNSAAFLGSALSSTADNSFDVVMSCVGAMLAPHKATADELVRVVRLGGTIGMINWDASGGLSAVCSPR